MSASFPHSPPLALCLGGMDSSAGAGLIRDVLTLAAFGVHPMPVSTAETLQNGESCGRIVLPAVSPGDQVDCLAPHLKGIWGLKLGMCGLPAEALAQVLARLERHAPAVRIWDPVQAPTSGVGLHDPASLRALSASVLATPGWVVSPNRPEASALTGLPGTADPAALAEPLLRAGAEAVWLKGGHSEGGDVEDWWVDARGARGLGRHPRLPGSRRGTGCTLASAWLALRLCGREPMAAAREAADWLRAQWTSAHTPGGFGRPIFAPRPA